MPNSVVSFDIGTYSIKAIQAQVGKSIVVERTVDVANTTGIVVPNDEGGAEKLAQVVNDIFSDHSLAKTDVRIALPESLVSTKIISIPPLTDAELASAINWQAEQHIPIPLEELSLEYQVIFRPDHREKGAQMRVLLVGVRKSVIDRYLDVFLRAGIEPTVLETQTLSIYRSLAFLPDDPTTLIAHMGAVETTLGIIHQGEMRFVYTHANAGQLLTRAIEQAIQLDPKQAEQYKRTYGLDPSQLQGKLKEVMMPAMKVSLLEMQKAMQFFASENNMPVKRVLLSGGTAQLPGLVQFVTEQMGVEVLIASPFAVAQGEAPQADQPAFTVCMGLLMREK
jgi:type IV pilus assembly protein PilM